MNEFIETHKKMIVLLTAAAILVLVGWFAVGNMIYASTETKRKNADKAYSELRPYFGRGKPIAQAETMFNDTMKASREDLLKLQQFLQIRFQPYVAVPDEQKRTKQLYINIVLSKVREELAAKSMLSRMKTPPLAGWPETIDIPSKEIEKTVPRMLKQLSVTDSIMSLLIMSRARSVEKITVEEPYDEGAGEDTPKFVRHYPVRVNFVISLKDLITFLQYVHYVESASDRQIGQFFEVEFLDVTWVGDDPTDILAVDTRLNALDFSEQIQEIVRNPTATTKPGEALGH
ncbi:MAG: hypothetical protein WC712_03190 [Candidatus Brocadiia bacterium]